MDHAFLVLRQLLMATVQDIIDQLNRLAPFDIAESWDNSGLQAGDPAWEADKILIALDVTSAVMQEAVATGSNLVLTHHPLMMTPEKSIDFSTPAGYAIATCARHKISIVSAHTNLDKATAGLNDYFASKIGLTRLVGPLSRGSAGSDPEHDPGIGRLAVPDTPITLEQLIHKIKIGLGLKYLRVSGPMDLTVRKIAICTGSGGSLMPDFLSCGADVYVTGDVKYHEARQAEEASKALVDVGHFGSEQVAIDLMYEKLKPALDNAGIKTELICYKKEKDPFTIV